MTDYSWELPPEVSVFLLVLFVLVVVVIGAVIWVLVRMFNPNYRVGGSLRRASSRPSGATRCPGCGSRNYYSGRRRCWNCDRLLAPTSGSTGTENDRPEVEHRREEGQP
jgi:hypothetical protein